MHTQVSHLLTKPAIRESCFGEIWVSTLLGLLRILQLGKPVKYCVMVIYIPVYMTYVNCVMLYRCAGVATVQQCVCALVLLKRFNQAGALPILTTR